MCSKAGSDFEEFIFLFLSRLAALRSAENLEKPTRLSERMELWQVSERGDLHYISQIQLRNIAGGNVLPSEICFFCINLADLGMRSVVYVCVLNS